MFTHLTRAFRKMNNLVNRSFIDVHRVVAELSYPEFEEDVKNPESSIYRTPISLFQNKDIVTIVGDYILSPKTDSFQVLYPIKKVIEHFPVIFHCTHNNAPLWVHLLDERHHRLLQSLLTYEIVNAKYRGIVVIPYYRRPINYQTGKSLLMSKLASVKVLDILMRCGSYKFISLMCMINKKNNTNFLHCCASKWGEVGSKMMLHIAEMFFANPTTSQHLSDASSFPDAAAEDDKGKTPAHLAIQEDNADALLFLISLYGAPWFQDNNSYMKSALELKSNKCVKVLSFAADKYEILPNINNNQLEPDTMCGVCATSVEEDENEGKTTSLSWYQMNCKHYIHCECLMGMCAAAGNVQCPMCREDVGDEVLERCPPTIFRWLKLAERSEHNRVLFEAKKQEFYKQMEAMKPPRVVVPPRRTFLTPARRGERAIRIAREIATNAIAEATAQGDVNSYFPVLIDGSGEEYEEEGEEFFNSEEEALAFGRPFLEDEEEARQIQMRQFAELSRRGVSVNIINNDNPHRHISTVNIVQPVYGVEKSPAASFIYNMLKNDVFESIRSRDTRVGGERVPAMNLSNDKRALFHAASSMLCDFATETNSQIVGLDFQAVYEPHHISNYIETFGRPLHAYPGAVTFLDGAQDYYAESIRYDNDIVSFSEMASELHITEALDVFEGSLLSPLFKKIRTGKSYSNWNDHLRRRNYARDIAEEFVRVCENSLASREHPPVHVHPFRDGAIPILIEYIVDFIHHCITWSMQVNALHCMRKYIEHENTNVHLLNLRPTDERVEVLRVSQLRWSRLFNEQYNTRMSLSTKRLSLMKIFNHDLGVSKFGVYKLLDIIEMYCFTLI